MASFKDWLTVTWAQGGMPLRSEGDDADSEYDNIKTRCGRAGSLAAPGERFLELLRPNSSIPRRHSTAACAPQSTQPVQHSYHHHSGFKYCPSDALPYCPPSGVPPKIIFTSGKVSTSQIKPPPVPQRMIPAPPKHLPPAMTTSPPVPPARNAPPQQPKRIPPPTPPRPVNKDTNGNPQTVKEVPVKKIVPIPPPPRVDTNRNSIQRNASHNKLLDNEAFPTTVGLVRSPIPPPITTVNTTTNTTMTNGIRRSPSSGSNMSVRQDSNVSSDSFSQTSSPSYTTKTMEAPLLPHHHINKKYTKALLVPNRDNLMADSDNNMSITKSVSTPASLQTIVRLQQGSNVSLHHKMLRDIRDSTNSPKQFRLVQVMVNVIALFAIAGGLAAYFRAYPTVKYIPHVVVNHTVIEHPPAQAIQTINYVDPTGLNPAPGICLPIIVTFCQAQKIPYNYTLFPNYIGNFGQRDAQMDLEIYEAVVDVRCYELTALFLCSVFVPKCGPLGHMVRPCRSLCFETTRRCGFFLDVFGLSMPEYLQCDVFPESSDTDVCVGHKEVREARIRAQKPVCPTGFQCDVRRCIPADWRCDGHIDCFDQSDELNCRSCQHGTIHCGEKKCVAQSHMCDGKIDCPWGQDERNCLRLSKDNGDVGNGQVELFRPAEQSWLPACFSHVDELTSKKICSMLGYSKLNKSNIEDEANVIRGVTDAWTKFHMRDSTFLKEMRNCNRNTKRINLVCHDYVCGRRRIQPASSKRIVGGVPAAPGDWPFIAAILGGPEEIFYCAGVLIADEWVLTASHCVGNHSDVSGWTIQLGITRRNSHAYYGHKAKVKRVIPHPLYNIGIAHDNDIALFQLKNRVSYHEHLSPVCLPPPELEIKPGTYCTVIGWGKRDDNNEYEPAVNEVAVPVLSRELCNTWLEHRDLNVTEGMLCAGYPEGGKDACQGDSGGPLLCKVPDDEERWFVGGIVSWGIKCAHPRLPGVYAYVPKYIPWIMQQIELYAKNY